MEPWDNKGSSPQNARSYGRQDPPDTVIDNNGLMERLAGDQEEGSCPGLSKSSGEVRDVARWATRSLT